MSQLDLIAQSNGGFRNFGWARLRTTFMDSKSITIKLFGDSSYYGRIPCANFSEGFLFSSRNTPENILAQISRSFFSIFRQPSTSVNFHPAVIRVFGRNGLHVNEAFVAQNEEKILKNGDYIKMSSSQVLFQFIDDRVFDIRGIPNRIIRKYHLDSYMGKGGQSTVRMIHDLVNGGKFALKIIPKGCYEDELAAHHEKRLQHMVNEVKIMRQLRHVNIIRFVETFETKNDLFIVMESADSDLLQLMKTFPGSFLPESVAKFCLYQVVKGLDYIHRRNIAHRDLKVENIFVTHRYIGGRNEPILKIGDFGYSKKADQHLTTQLGTPCYYPPEIQDHRGEYTLKADIWTLGCMFYGCVSGGFPFHHSYGQSVPVQIAKAQLKWSQQQWNYVSCFDD